MTDSCSRHDAKSYYLLSQMDNQQLKNYAEIHISMDSQDLIQILAERLPNEENKNR